jgi:hypothetical protein
MYIWLLAYAGARGTSLDGFNLDQPVCLNLFAIPVFVLSVV